MSANNLLLWMSARERGSWTQFRSAVHRLCDSAIELPQEGEDAEGDSTSLPIHQSLRLNLERFGFAEFFGAPEEREWRVAPPVLAVTRTQESYTGFIAGARSDNLLARIHAAVGQNVVRTEARLDSPDWIAIVADDLRFFSALATEARLYFQVDAPAAILSVLRPITSWSLGRPFEAPLGNEWVIERFRERHLRWVSSTRQEMQETSSGLFRMRHRYRTEIVLRSSGAGYQAPLQVGKFINLKRVRVRVLAYDPGTLTLTVPAICRPPLLIERALLLCSGHLPEFEAARSARAILHYHGVPRSVARTVAALLRQELL